MAQTLIGTDEAGAGVETGLASHASAILRGDKTCTDRQNLRRIMRVAATGAFHLNLYFTPDGGTSWLIGEQVASSTVTVDNGTANYTQSAELDFHIGYREKIEIYNNTGGTIDYGFNTRECT